MQFCGKSSSSPRRLTSTDAELTPSCRSCQWQSPPFLPAMSMISGSLRSSQEGRPAPAGSRFVRKHLDATRHEEFWFHDGSIVLLVGALMFRVHQTVLSTHSEVFAGLFVVPQPPAGTKGQEMIEGCHVVQLHDDPSDFVDLLKGIYHPWCVSFRIPYNSDPCTQPFRHFARGAE